MKKKTQEPKRTEKPVLAFTAKEVKAIEKAAQKIRKTLDALDAEMSANQRPAKVRALAANLDNASVNLTENIVGEAYQAAEDRLNADESTY